MIIEIRYDRHISPEVASGIVQCGDYASRFELVLCARRCLNRAGRVDSSSKSLQLSKNSVRSDEV